MSQPDAIYSGLERLLRGYLSASSVTAALGSTMKRRGLSPQTLDRQELPEVVAEAMVGLRMFCDPARIGDLMVDLAEYCDEVAADPEAGS